MNDRDRFDRFTERAKNALNFAQEEAIRLDHNYIGTEHLLLGLIHADGVAAAVLSNFGVELNKVRGALTFIIGKSDRTVLGQFGLTPRAKKVIELAVDEARRMNRYHIGTEHLLLGLIREGEGIAAGVLESLGINLEKARRMTIKVLSAPNMPQHSPINTVYKESGRSTTASAPPARNTVFISYSHQDREHLLRLQVYLKQHKIAKESFDLPVWDDTQIAVGSDWFAKIKQAVESAVVAVLLVSENFLASDFIDQYELPWLLEAARQGKTLLIPVILSHCAFEDREDLAHIQSINSPNRPLIGLPEPDRGALWNEVARKVRLALQAHQTKSSEPAG